MIRLVYVLLGEPASPGKLQVEDLNRTGISLAWEKPEFDGGSPVTGYYVERRQGYSSRWTRVNRVALSTPALTLKDLIENEDYEFRVVAENEAGVSKPSKTTGVITARDPFTKPGRPGKLTANLSDDTVTLSWTAPPDDDGRSPVTNYIVQQKVVGDTRWEDISGGLRVARPTYTVKDLRVDEEYEFRVIAENNAGSGPSSAPSQPVKYGKLRLSFVKTIVQSDK